MSEPSDVEKKATSYLGHAARLDRTVTLPSGRLEVWRSAGRLPSKVAPFYVGEDGEPFRTNASWKTFERMLKAARPDLADSELLARLMAFGPGRTLVPTREFEVPEAYRQDGWAPARTPDGGFVAHAVDTIGGRWERIAIAADYAIHIEDRGPAPKIPVR
jgi:hypothetical protein